MNRYNGLDDAIVRNVKIYARKLKSAHVLRFLDIDDIEQELMCEVLKSISNFDPSKSCLEHYIRMVLARRSVNLLEFYSFKKRSGFAVISEYEDEYYSPSESNIGNHKNPLLFELEKLIIHLPEKYQTVCNLLRTHSTAAAAHVLSRSRMSIFRTVRRISQIANHAMDAEFLNILTSMKGLSMREIAILDALNAKEVSDLNTSELRSFIEQINDVSSKIKAMKEKLDDGLNLKFAEMVKSNLRNIGKDTGTVKFLDNDFLITAEVPKKVTWDTNHMEAAIRDVSDDFRREFIKISYTIDEKKYAALSPEEQQRFKPARTVIPGKIRFQIGNGGNQ